MNTLCRQIGGISSEPEATAYYLGDKDTDGTWRFIPSGDNVVFEKREAGVWVEHGGIYATP